MSIASDQVSRQGALGDFDGDGRIEILLSHIDGVVRCYDGATGALRWELPIGTRLADMAVCDIDGDGLVEAIGGGLDGRLYADRQRPMRLGRRSGLLAGQRCHRRRER